MRDDGVESQIGGMSTHSAFNASTAIADRE